MYYVSTQGPFVNTRGKSIVILVVNKCKFCNVDLGCNSGKFLMFAVWSDKCATGSINMLCAVFSVQCLVCSV